jgi:hypothetical protein
MILRSAVSRAGGHRAAGSVAGLRNSRCDSTSSSAAMFSRTSARRSAIASISPAKGRRAGQRIAFGSKVAVGERV